MSKTYYIASSLENADAVRALKKTLDAHGWHHTYDWTVHGSVQREGVERIAEVAAAEADGVFYSEVVIVLLPGGRGTHTELGIAISAACADEDMRVCIFSPDPEKDFGTSGTTCAFYHHPRVDKFTSMDEMTDALLEMK